MAAKQVTGFLAHVDLWFLRLAAGGVPTPFPCGCLMPEPVHNPVHNVVDIPVDNFVDTAWVRVLIQVSLHRWNGRPDEAPVVIVGCVSRETSLSPRFEVKCHQKAAVSAEIGQFYIDMQPPATTNQHPSHLSR